MSVLLKQCEKLKITEKPRLNTIFSFYMKDFSNVASNEETVHLKTLQEGEVSDESKPIDDIRDKSRLKPEHRNILFNKRPYSEPLIKYHSTVKYNRKLFGKYGSASGVNPGIAWPTKIDLENRREYERVAYPHTIQEMVSLAEKEIQMKEFEIKERQEKISENYAKLKTWERNLKEKIAKKEADALAAKQKKEQLVEEVRRHFGFTVDPREEKFKEMLVLKEKEQRKLDKQTKLQERERKAIEKLMGQTQSNKSQGTDSTQGSDST